MAAYFIVNTTTLSGPELHHLHGTSPPPVGHARHCLCWQDTRPLGAGV